MSWVAAQMLIEILFYIDAITRCHSLSTVRCGLRIRLEAEALQGAGLEEALLRFKALELSYRHIFVLAQLSPSNLQHVSHRLHKVSRAAGQCFIADEIIERAFRSESLDSSRPVAGRVSWDVMDAMAQYVTHANKPFSTTTQRLKRYMCWQLLLILLLK